jgi:NAD(P)H dehydrogenase (quinone)
MKVLVVYAHPNPKSFNHAILESFTEGLKEGGHTPEVVDLYGISFNPCLGLEDFAQFSGGQMPKDVLEQQKKVAQADALAFICPVWNWSYPAILKGWIDRVFSFGFAYKIGQTGEPEGLLKHKKVLLISTTMGSGAGYKASGIEDAMKKVDVMTFTFVYGIQKVEHAFLYDAATDAEARKGHLDTVHSLGRKF